MAMAVIFSCQFSSTLVLALTYGLEHVVYWSCLAATDIYDRRGYLTGSWVVGTLIVLLLSSHEETIGFAITLQLLSTVVTSAFERRQIVYYFIAAVTFIVLPSAVFGTGQRTLMGFGVGLSPIGLKIAISKIFHK